MCTPSVLWLILPSVITVLISAIAVPVYVPVPHGAKPGRLAVAPIVLRQIHILRHLLVLIGIGDPLLQILTGLLVLLRRIPVLLPGILLLCRGFLPRSLLPLLHARRIPVIGRRHTPPAALSVWLLCRTCRLLRGIRHRYFPCPRLICPDRFRF